MIVERVPIKIKILSRLFIVHLHYQNMSKWPRQEYEIFLGSVCSNRYRSKELSGRTKTIINK